MGVHRDNWDGKWCTINLLRMFFSQDVRVVLIIFQKAKVKLKRLINSGPVIVNTDENIIYEVIVSVIEGVLDHWVVKHSEKE